VKGEGSRRRRERDQGGEGRRIKEVKGEGSRRRRERDQEGEGRGIKEEKGEARRPPSTHSGCHRA
jgi:hypothetical protein